MTTAGPLNYPATGVSAPETPPKGWRSVEVRQVVGHGFDEFDALAERLRGLHVHAAAGIHADPSAARAADLLAADSGPLRGRCRVVQRIDESLRQGVVLGTTAGNRAVAEHRSVLSYDGRNGDVRARVRTVWRADEDFFLPGGPERRERAHRRLVARVLAGLVTPVAA